MEVFGKTIVTNGRLLRIGLLDGEGYQFLEDPELAMENMQNSGLRIDLFTFVQRLGEDSPDSPKYEYSMEIDNLAALPVSTFDNWMKNQVDFKVRNKVRKAEKTGVLVKEVSYEDSFVHGISAIYDETPVRQGKPFWHYKKDIDTVRRMNGTFNDRSIYLGAYFEDSLIGFVKLVMDEKGRQAGLMQIVSMIQHRDKAPTNALIAQAVRSCADRGIPYLWYANFSYGKKQSDSLADFKRHNGFQKVLVPRYYVPLTLVGKAALRMGLQHGLRERIPEPISRTYRKIRGLWYAKTVPCQES